MTTQADVASFVAAARAARSRDHAPADHHLSAGHAVPDGMIIPGGDQTRSWTAMVASRSGPTPIADTRQPEISSTRST